MNDISRQIGDKKALLTHTLFWLIYGSLMVLFFDNMPRHSTTEAIVKTGELMFFQMLLVYLNWFYLVPRLFANKQYWQYFIIVLVLSVFAVALLMWIRNTFHHSPEHFIKRRVARKFIHKIFFHRSSFEWLSLISVLFLSTAYQSIQIAHRKTTEAIETMNEKLATEMKFLKSQINPHFLFNALHNIYTLSFLKSDAAPDMILKLSDMLRYNIYDCSAEKVLLKKEVDYLNNFIDLHRLKDNELNIKVEIGHIDEQVKVAPMLLIPFLENSFKHSKIEDTNAGWIRLKLFTDQYGIHFHISNSIPQMDFVKDAQGGIGLQNVKRRLELLYPNLYELTITNQDQIFSVELHIAQTQ
ncbi:MAG: sensor histidine kinase [Flammeovirgaceae bacterium]